jgi:hypothetical protein
METCPQELNAAFSPTPSCDELMSCSLLHPSLNSQAVEREVAYRAVTGARSKLVQPLSLNPQGGQRGRIQQQQQQRGGVRSPPLRAAAAAAAAAVAAEVGAGVGGAGPMAARGRRGPAGAAAAALFPRPSAGPMASSQLPAASSSAVAAAMGEARFPSPPVKRPRPLMAFGRRVETTKRGRRWVLGAREGWRESQRGIQEATRVGRSPHCGPG